MAQAIDLSTKEGFTSFLRESGDFTVEYSREHNRFPILPSFLFSPHGPSDKGSTISVLAHCINAVYSISSVV
jgi:hypothetical protein